MKGLQDATTIEGTLVNIRDEEEMRALLSAILSRAEYEKISKRWEAYQLRVQGMPLAQIVSGSKVAVATATRSAAIRRSSNRRILDIIIARAASKPTPNHG